MKSTDKKITQLKPGCCVHKWDRKVNWKPSMFMCGLCGARIIREEGIITSFVVPGAERY